MGLLRAYIQCSLCLLYMPLVVVNDEPECVAQFQAYPAGDGDGYSDASDVGVPGLFEYLQQEFLLFYKALQCRGVQLAACGIHVLKSLHFVELVFGQHAVGEVVAQQTAAEMLLW